MVSGRRAGDFGSIGDRFPVGPTKLTSSEPIMPTGSAKPLAAARRHTKPVDSINFSQPREFVIKFCIVAGL
jgi:hypothetical protein